MHNTAVMRHAAKQVKKPQIRSTAERWQTAWSTVKRKARGHRNTSQNTSIIIRSVKKLQRKVPETEDLRDFVPVQKLQEDMRVLRDIAIWQDTVFKGLISYLTDDVLHDDIGLKCNRLYDNGMEVSGMAPETDILSKIIKRQESFEKD
ncbi:MAG TPA: hypothetical protein DD381_14465 [Lentisphaeria bacterium]|nr:hypothetical protein [Lentisphaeria bacterium]